MQQRDRRRTFWFLVKVNFAAELWPKRFRHLGVFELDLGLSKVTNVMGKYTGCCGTFALYFK